MSRVPPCGSRPTSSRSTRRSRWPVGPVMPGVRSCWPRPEHRRASFLRERLGAMMPIDDVLYSADLGVQKHEAAFFELASARLGVATDQRATSCSSTTSRTTSTRLVARVACRARRPGEPSTSGSPRSTGSSPSDAECAPCQRLSWGPETWARGTRVVSWGSPRSSGCVGSPTPLGRTRSAGRRPSRSPRDSGATRREPRSRSPAAAACRRTR